MFQCHNNIGVTALHHWAPGTETGEEEGHDRGGVKNFQESFPFYCIYLVSGKYHCHSIVLCVLRIAYIWLCFPPAPSLGDTHQHREQLQSLVVNMFSISPAWHGPALQHWRPTWQNMCHISQNICTNFPLCTLTNNGEQQDLTMAMEGVK